MITETAVAAPAPEEIPAPEIKPPDFTAKLVPGAAIPAGTIPQNRQGTGQADGVLYMRGRSDAFGQTVHKDMELEALRYLKGHSPAWLALHPGTRGRCRPQFEDILAQPRNQQACADILKMAYATGQNFTATFFMSEHVEFDKSVNAVRPEHIFRWHVVPTETEGVWAVFYV